MISVSAPQGDVCCMRLETSRIGSRGFLSGKAAIEAALAQGKRAILLDMAAANNLRASDLALLVELTSCALPMSRLVLVNVSPTLMGSISEAGIDRIVPVYANEERALEAPEVKSALLAHTPAVVLSAGKGSRMAPLSKIAPKPMLDMMGSPILEHILLHLKSFGIKDVYLNPGHLGHQLPEHFGPGHHVGQSIFYANEGRWRDGRWVADPMGSAATLARLTEDHNCLATDTIVMCGDALVDVDLAAMLARHRATNADVTIAAQHVEPQEVHKYGIMVADDAGRIIHFQEKPSEEEARSTLANTGIYILSPRVREHLSRRHGADIASDLLPAVLSAGGTLQVFADDFSWTDIGCPRDYMSAWQLALSGEISVLSKDAIELKEGVWAHPSANVARLSDIEGPCYLSAGTQIERGASLRGPIVLGRNCTVQSGAYLRNSILMENTAAEKGALVDGMIAAPGWAVAHAYADGSAQTWDPLPGISSTTRSERSSGAELDVLATVAPRFANAG